jgi:EAL domain-containing protein (putative c-di-GMP-specific phosphodiesterase class I)
MSFVPWRRETYSSGMVIFREGDTGRDAYLIEKGSVNIARTNGKGEESLVLTLQAGEIFGEIALVDNLPRTASAVAAEPTTLIAINSGLFFDKLKHSDPLLAHLLGLVVSRFRVSNTGGNHAAEAVAEHLTALREYAVCNIRATQDMSEAIEREEFLVYYQPVVHLADGSLAGFEALVRWKRQDGSVSSPAEFISLAENTGLILPLGRWMTAEALRGFHQLQARMTQCHPGQAGLFISINLSARQLMDPEELEAVMAVIRDSGANPHQVKIEITESMMMENADHAIEAMHRLKLAGMLLAIDDFGTGYSSLSYLERMPLDNLKIDQSFVRAMRDQANGQRIVRAIAALARELGMDCIAEGVEDIEDEQALKALGCRYGQGYLFARPLSQADALTYVEQRGEAYSKTDAVTP